jgi:hypothetical protein
MKTLELNQMENLIGGATAPYKLDQAPPGSNGDGFDFLTGCGGASVGLALGFVGLVAGGASVVGAGIGAAGFIFSAAQWGAACR